jgi:two-component system OmpR family response regulator
MSRRIAIVEDDRELRRNYAEALSREGYEVRSYGNRAEAEKAFAAELPDMAILDIMLEDEREGGFELCRFLRAKSEVVLPIIFLTARNSDVDRVSGLRLGAIDYLFKDMTTLEFLLVRVHSFFSIIDEWKENKPAAGEKSLNVGRLSVSRREVAYAGRPVSLTLTEYWILHELVKNPGNLKTHGQLMDAARTVVTDNAIAAYIRRIRDKFKEIDPEFSCIRTEYGMGYRWVNAG